MNMHKNIEMKIPLESDGKKKYRKKNTKLIFRKHAVHYQVK